MTPEPKTGAPSRVPTSEKRRSLPATFSSLRNPDFRYLWLGALFNNAADWIQQVTVGWLVWELSGSPFLVGVVGGLRAVPFLFMGPIGGVAADRLDRRKLLMGTQFILAVVAIAFAVVVAMGWVRVWHVLLFTFITGCGFSVNVPTRWALVANTVPSSELGNAIALNSVANNLTRIIGPAAGGLLIVAFGPAGNFLIQAGLFLGIAAIVFPMKVRYRDTAGPSSPSSAGNLREGFTYILSNRTLLSVMTLVLIPSFFVQPLLHLLPVFTDEVLHSQANIYGYLVSAYGVGGLLAALTLASLGKATRSGLLGIATITTSSIIAILFALSGVLALSMLLLAALGFSHMAFNVNNNTLVQTMIPDRLRGRITGIYNLDAAFRPLATLILGMCAELFSAPRAVAVSGMLGLVATAALILGIKQMRDLRHLRA